MSDRLKQLKQQAQAVYRQEMKDAIERLKVEDPAKFAELVKRARDEDYDAKVQREAMAERVRALDEERRRLEYERMRSRMHPVIAVLPNIDMTGVHGIVAFRVWNYDDVGLRSTARQYHWKEVNFADRVPTEYNQSGFYCIKLSGLGVLTTGANFFGTGRENVSGFVELLGHWEEHTDGVIRAEVARLICLFVTSENNNIGSVVRSLYERYPVTPVFVLNPEQLAEVVMREVLRQKYVRGYE